MATTCGALPSDALYNAGNLHFAKRSRRGRTRHCAALPLLELAKQSYRGRSASRPASWDARYNLERALWLAPELEETRH